MSNSPTIKLYTEDQMRKIFRLGYCTAVTDEINEDFTIDYFRPIELPTDEEIENHIEDDFLNSTEVHKYSEETQLLMKAMCKAGALWIRDKIGGKK